YVNSVSERLVLYKDLDSITDKVALQKYRESLRDRFGPLPYQAEELIETIKLRWVAERLGFEKIILRSGRLFGHFVSNPSSHFYNSEIFNGIMLFVKDNGKQCRMKQEGNKLSLSIQNIANVMDAYSILSKMNTVKTV